MRQNCVDVTRLVQNKNIARDGMGCRFVMILMLYLNERIFFVKLGYTSKCATFALEYLTVKFLTRFFTHYIQEM